MKVSLMSGGVNLTSGNQQVSHLTAPLFSKDTPSFKFCGCICRASYWHFVTTNGRPTHGLRRHPIHHRHTVVFMITRCQKAVVVHATLYKSSLHPNASTNCIWLPSLIYPHLIPVSNQGVTCVLLQSQMTNLHNFIACLSYKNYG